MRTTSGNANPIRAWLGLSYVLVFLCGLVGPSALAAEKARLEPVATGLTAPMAMAQPRGDDRMFVAEQVGQVRILVDGKVLPEPFLDLHGKANAPRTDFDHLGLLGLAFHPDFSENGKFYVAYTRPLKQKALDFQGYLVNQGDIAQKMWWSHTNVVSEFTVSEDNPNVADPNSEVVISAIDWPQFNHPGHWIDIGPDGKLYISTGDGGYANDWGIGHNQMIGNGQDLLSPHGKILRVNLDGSVPQDNPFVGRSGALPEIWAYGLRHPWRCSFDMAGDNLLFCGDVGQDRDEEVDVIERGHNYGWRVMEAAHCFDPRNPTVYLESCDDQELARPILEYRNCKLGLDDCRGTAVIGGYVYRGSHEPWYGKYIFGDWSTSFLRPDGHLFMATPQENGWKMEQVEVVNMDGPLPFIVAFGQGTDGEVYALTSETVGPSGEGDVIYKIVPAK
jgi:glucose/arabinose dehydrogenase